MNRNNTGKGKPQLLHDFEVSKRLGVSINTLRNWRYQGKGPDFVKLEGRFIMYEESAVEYYIEGQKMSLDEQRRKG